MPRRDRWYRALARVPGAACAATLGVVVLASAVLAGCDSEPEQGPVQAAEGAFYLEARVSVYQSGADPSQPKLLPSESELRWWYQDRRQFRHEIEWLDTIVRWPPFVIAADGEYQRTYDPRSMTYEEVRLPDSMGPYGGMPPISIVLGPMPAASLDEFMDQWRTSMDTVERVGTAEVLGRPVEIVEFGPIWRESSSQSGGGSVETSGGVGRVYVDTDLGMVLRYEVAGQEGHGQGIEAEVTVLDLEPEFSTETFALALPSDARPATSSSGSCGSEGSSAGMWAFDSGYLRPTYDSEGWTPAGSGSMSGADCAVTEQWGSVTRGDGEYIILTQSPVPAAGAPGIHDVATVDIAGLEGYRARTETPEGEVTELLWIQEGIIARLQTNAAPFEELVRIAESVEVVP